MNSWELKIDCQKGDLSLSIELSGDSCPLALIGANGSGKSTVLRAALGLENLQRGYFRVGEQILHDSAQAISVPVEQRNLAYLPQGLGLFPHMTVAKNIIFADPESTLSESGLKDRYSELLSELKVIDLLQRFPEELSAGERQKVALVRLMIQQPRMVLLDEPASALDILARREVRKVLASQLSSLGIPTLLVTHDFRDVQELGAKMAYLKDGKIEGVGSLEDFLKGETDEFLSEFLAQP